MECHVCHKDKLEFEVRYNKRTLEPTCRICMKKDQSEDEFITYENMLEELNENIKGLINKSISTRLDLQHLVYFMKFAQHSKANNISQAFQNMIDELMNHLDLSDEPVPVEPFNHSQLNLKRKAKVNKKETTPNKADDEEEGEVMEI